MLTKKYPSTTRIVGIVLRSYIPNSGDKISLYDVIISMEGIVQVGKICGVSSSEIQLEFYALDMIYMRINTILECELKKISLKDILI